MHARGLRPSAAGRQTASYCAAQAACRVLAAPPIAPAIPRDRMELLPYTRREVEQKPANTRNPVAALSAEVYQELRAIAARQFRREREGHTLQPTALVHEAYVRLGKQQNLAIHSRTHFLSIAARQMRQILVDHARFRGRHKRGGDQQRVTLVTNLVDSGNSVDLLALEDALNALDEFSPEGRKIVELKFFGGMTEVEIAESLGLSERTVRRRWVFARSWLYQELNS